MLTFVTSNFDFHSPGNRAYLRWLCEDADVLLLQEVKDVDLAALLPDGWTSLQDTTSEAHANTAIAVRDETVRVIRHHVRLGVEPFIDGRRVEMLARYIAVARIEERGTGRRCTAISGHTPPDRFAELQPKYVAELRSVLRRHDDAVIGIDANDPITDLARDLGRGPALVARGRGIVGILTNLKVEEHDVLEWGQQHGLTDHPAVLAVVRLPRQENR